MWLVPDFGCQSLDMGPKIGWYSNCFGTCIELSTLENPYKMGITHKLRQRHYA